MQFLFKVVLNITYYEMAVNIIQKYLVCLPQYKIDLGSTWDFSRAIICISLLTVSSPENPLLDLSNFRGSLILGFKR